MIDAKDGSFQVNLLIGCISLSNSAPKHAVRKNIKRTFFCSIVPVEKSNKHTKEVRGGVLLVEEETEVDEDDGLEELLEDPAAYAIDVMNTSAHSVRMIVFIQELHIITPQSITQSHKVAIGT